MQNNLPVIAGVEITTDEHGRFNLNALHKASGLGKAKQPSNWLRLETTKSLIDEVLNSSDLRNNPVEQQTGANGGTFAHELLAISYAGWISPSFQLQVNQTFLDFKTGKLTKPALPDFNNPAEAARAWADEYEGKLKALEKLDVADQEIQRLQGVCNDIAAQFAPGMTPACFCRQLNGVNVQKVQSYLVERGILYRQKRDYRVSGPYRDNWMTERHESPVKGVTRTKVLLTKKGARCLYKLYLKTKLPMKKDWDGNFSHVLF